MSDISKLANSMQARMPWRSVGRKVLKEQGLGRSQGWDNTVLRLTSREVPGTKELIALTASLTEHNLVGEKLSRFYQLDKDDAESLWDAVLDLKIPNSEFSKRYPASFTEEELAALPMGHALVDVTEFPDQGVAVVFSSIRIVTTREKIEPEDFPADAAEVIEGYDEIVGLKTRRVQGMDVLWIPYSSELIDVRVDFPRGMHQQAGVYAHASLGAALAGLVGRDYLTSPANLFSIIAPMYVNKSEGSVVELAFGTTTASTKHEKMRRSSLSLRDETYHKGGKAALSAPISPFKLSIEWRRPIGDGEFSQPELNLHSSARTGDQDGPVLHDAIIRNCIGLDDYKFVRDRIEYYLQIEANGVE